MFKNLFTIFILLISFRMAGQNSFLKYYDFKSEYGNTYAITQVKNSIIGSGIFWDTTTLPHRQNILLYETDLSGSLLSFNFYSNSDTSNYSTILTDFQFFQNLIKIDDESFAMCYFNQKKRCTEILKFNKNLSLITKKSIIAFKNDESVFPVKLMEIDNFIILCCYEKVIGNQYKSYLYKFDWMLNQIWKKEIPEIEKVRSFEHNSESNDFIFSQYELYNKIVLTDTLLNIKNAKIDNISKEDLLWLNIKHNANKGYLTSNVDIIGNDPLGHMLIKNIVSYGKSLEKQWKYHMGGTPDITSTVVDIIPSSDDAYFAFGQVGARIADVRDLYSSDSFDIMILSKVKFKDDGKIIWHRYDTLDQGYYKASYASSRGMIATEDGGIYISGKLDYFDTIRVNNVLKLDIVAKYFLMKIDSNGCVDGLHCNVEPKSEVILSSKSEIAQQEHNFSIYPNPNTGRFTIDPVEGSRQVVRVDLCIYDTKGQQIYFKELPDFNTKINMVLSDRPPGEYFSVLKKEGKIIAYKPFLIIK